MTRTAIFDDQECESFASSVDRFVIDRYPLERQRELARSASGFCRETWREMADLGWMVLSVPADHGGLGGGVREEAIVMAGIGRGLLLEPFLASAILSPAIVASIASEAQQAALLPAMASGECLYALGDQDGAAPMIARVQGDGWRLDGDTLLVLHGDAADRLLIAAAVEGETGGSEIGIFLVDAAAAGVSRVPFHLIDGRRGADIALRGTPAERLGAGDARAAIATTRVRGTIAVCAEALGAMAALNALTLAYAKTRQQFGVTIGSFQVIQHRLVDMAVAEVESRSIVAAAAEAFDADHPMAAMMVSAAKLRINRAARLIGEGAIQLHGGIGMTEELAVGHYFKRLLAIGALFGDCDHHLDRLADAA